MKEEKPDRKRQKYRRPAWFWPMVQVWLDAGITPSVTKRCEAAGISRSCWYDAVADERFVVDFEGVLERITVQEETEVRTGIRRAIARGDVEAMRLWLQYFERRVRPLPRKKREGKAGEPTGEQADEMEGLLRQQADLNDRAARLLADMENEEE